MKLIQWTLFIDMLGYRDINGSINSHENAEKFIEFMMSNKKIFTSTDSEERKEFYKKEVFDLYEYYEIQSAFVSDSLIITYSPREVNTIPQSIADMHSANALFIIVMRLQAFILNCYSEMGLFLRGGISNKYCYIKENFAVGEGLIEAYLAESKYAINPRIILHPTVQENKNLMDKINFISNEMYAGKSIIQEDSDGIYFIDHIGYAISLIDINIPMNKKAFSGSIYRYAYFLKTVDYQIKMHYDAISKKLSELFEKRKHLTIGSDEDKKLLSVIDKFIWLKNYHNSKIAHHEYLSRYLIKLNACSSC